MFGILISLVGSIYGYLGTPKDSIEFDDTFPYTEKEKQNIVKGFLDRRKFSKRGFLLLIIGFISLAIAQLFVYPS